MTSHPVFSESMSPRYQVLKLLNSGGKGLIYFAKDTVLNRDVAIKVLKKSNSVQDLMAFQNEAKAIGQLNHLNIVLVHDFVLNEQGHASMIMEFVEGTDLHQVVLNRGKLSLNEALAIFMQVCQGMHHAHSNGIVHRDMKSANILIAEGQNASCDAGAVKIADFGLARYFSDDSSVSTGGGGNLIGTPAYISPEQAQGSKGDPRSDIYSFGCVMFEVLTGEFVFSAETLTELALKHVNEEPPVLPRVTDSHFAQKKMELIVSRCLAKNREDRFDSFLDLEAQLKEVKELLALEKSRHGQGENRQGASGKSKKPVLINLMCIGIVVLAGGSLFVIFANLITLQAKKPDLAPVKEDMNSSYPLENPTVSRKLMNKIADMGPIKNIGYQNFEIQDRWTRVTGNLEKSVGIEESIKPMPDVRAVYIDGQLTVEAAIMLRARKTEMLRFVPEPCLARDGTTVTKAALMDAVGNIESLRLLELSGNKIGSNDLRPLIKLKNLTVLYIESEHLTDSACANLAQIKSLEHLFITPAYHITDKGLFELTKLPNLVQLHLGHLRKATPAGLIPIIHMRSLRKLGMPAVRCLNKDVMSAVISSNLTDLGIYGSNVDIDMAKMLASSKSLKRLLVSGTDFTHKDLQYLKTFMPFAINKPFSKESK